MDGLMDLPFERIKHLLVDLDGVIYRGSAALPAAPEFVMWLRHRQIEFRLVTNNATLTVQQYRAKLEAMGIAVEAEEIFTSSLATARYLQEQGQRGRSAYVIGEEGLRQALLDAGIRIVEDGPDWVIVGLDRDLTYGKLATAALAISAGARFLGTNPDTSFPSERGLVPGAGAILAALTATTGVRPVVVGKPQPLMLRLAMTSMGGTAEDSAMLGDRLDTDIAGAAAVGMPSILVLTGVSTRAELSASPVQPNLVVDDLDKLIRAWPAPVSH
jgi:4-nitrophenyl phosphatase